MLLILHFVINRDSIDSGSDKSPTRKLNPFGSKLGALAEKLIKEGKEKQEKSEKHGAPEKTLTKRPST